MCLKRTKINKKRPGLAHLKIVLRMIRSVFGGTLAGEKGCVGCTPYPCCFVKFCVNFWRVFPSLSLRNIFGKAKRESCVTKIWVLHNVVNVTTYLYWITLTLSMKRDIDIFDTTQHLYLIRLFISVWNLLVKLSTANLIKGATIVNYDFRAILVITIIGTY